MKNSPLTQQTTPQSLIPRTTLTTTYTPSQPWQPLSSSLLQPLVDQTSNEKRSPFIAPLCNHRVPTNIKSSHTTQILKSYSQLSFFAWTRPWHNVSARSRKAHEPPVNHILLLIFRHAQQIHASEEIEAINRKRDQSRAATTHDHERPENVEGKQARRLNAVREWDTNTRT